MTNTDFDFVNGSWDVANRRLVTPLADGSEWEEFPGTLVAHGFFDGAGSFDEMTFPTKGWGGAGIRLFVPERKEWSDRWVDNRTGQLQQPLYGRYANRGVDFRGDDLHEGRQIRVRQIWSRVTPTSFQWEQAFSVDEEKAWETNWVMTLTRRA